MINRSAAQRRLMRATSVSALSMDSCLAKMCFVLSVPRAMANGSIPLYACSLLIRSYFGNSKSYRLPHSICVFCASGHGNTDPCIVWTVERFGCNKVVSLFHLEVFEHRICIELKGLGTAWNSSASNIRILK